jgi:hypothetical protein
MKGLQAVFSGWGQLFHVEQFWFDEKVLCARTAFCGPRTVLYGDWHGSHGGEYSAGNRYGGWVWGLGRDEMFHVEQFGDEGINVAGGSFG